MCRKTKITKTEYKYLTCMCEQGKIKINDLCRHFTVTEKTVKTHIRNLYAKFDVHSKSELIYKYLTNKLNFIVIGGFYDEDL